MVKIAAETNLTAIFLLRPCQFQVPGVSNNLCEPTGMLIVDEGVAFVVSKRKSLQLQFVPQAPNVSLIRPVFLCQNARPNIVFLKQRLRPASNRRVSQCQGVRSVFRCQDARPASNVLLCQNANVRIVFN